MKKKWFYISFFTKALSMPPISFYSTEVQFMTEDELFAHMDRESKRRSITDRLHVNISELTVEGKNVCRYDLLEKLFPKEVVS